MGDIGFWPSVLGLHQGTYCCRNLSNGLLGLSRGPPRFMLRVSWPFPDNSMDLLDHLLSGFDPAYAITDDDAALPPWVQRLLGPRPYWEHTVIELALSFEAGRITTSAMLQLIDVLAAFATVQRRRGSREDGDGIEYRVVMLQVRMLCGVSGSAIEQLEGLIRSRCLHIRDLDISSDALMITEPVALQTFAGQFVTSPTVLRSDEDDLGPKTSDDDKDEPSLPLTVRRLGVAAAANTPQILSSMRYSDAIEELDLTCGYSEDIARWLAFALFHVDSDARVTTLRLRSRSLREGGNGPRLTPAWLTVFKQTLARVAPGQGLAKHRQMAASKKATTASAEDVPLSLNHRLFVTVKPGAKFKGAPSNRGPVVFVSGSDAITHFEVVHRLSSGWKALVIPGAGVAWIHSKMITGEHAVPTCLDTSAAPQTNGRLRSFTWCQDWQVEDVDLFATHADTIVELLSIIGSSLETLQMPHCLLQNRHFESILRYCPNLKHLNVAGNLISDVSPLVQAYHEHRCSIETLSIEQDHIQDTPSTNLVGEQIADILQRHPLALRQLGMSVFQFETTEDRREYDIKLVDAVDAAPRLEYTHLYMYETNPDMAFLNRQSVLMMPIRMPIRAELAFLSVIRAESTSARKLSALSQLDADVLSNIFRYAQPLGCKEVQTTLALDYDDPFDEITIF